jgi:hypothetical protein
MALELSRSRDNYIMEPGNKTRKSKFDETDREQRLFVLSLKRPVVDT